MNISRVRLRDSWMVGRGTHLAHTNDNLDACWADAEAEDDSQVDELMFKFNDARRDARKG